MKQAISFISSAENSVPVAKDYRMLLLAEGEEKLQEVSGAGGVIEVKVVRRGMKKEAVEAEVGGAREGGAGAHAVGLGEEHVPGILRAAVEFIDDLGL
ncbi:MAG: hypothetical protein NTW21_27040 [Verrucomicrobia bacterium]|nr:hypothetical protein [Verrucomicrobiota bacterium]